MMSRDLADHLRRGDRSRFLTALFAPPAARADLFALYTLHLEWARIRETVREPMLGQIRLQWWREAISLDGTIQSGTHEALNIIGPLIAAGRLSEGEFLTLIDAREAELDPAAPADLSALEAWLDGINAPLIRLALAILGVEEAPAELPIMLGRAQGLAGLMAALPMRLRQGKIDLPVHEMSAAGFSELDLRNTRPAGLSQAVRCVGARAEMHLASARPFLLALPPQGAPVRLLGTVTKRLLRRLAAAGYDPWAPAALRVDGVLPLALWWKHLTGGF